MGFFQYFWVRITGRFFVLGQNHWQIVVIFSQIFVFFLRFFFWNSMLYFTQKNQKTSKILGQNHWQILFFGLESLVEKKIKKTRKLILTCVRAPDHFKISRFFSKFLEPGKEPPVLEISQRISIFLEEPKITPGLMILVIFPVLGFFYS